MSKNYKILLTVLVAGLSILLLNQCKSNNNKPLNISCYKFTDINVLYSKTDDAGNNDEKILIDANPQNFTVIQNNNPENSCLNADIWGKDKMNVYYKDKKIKGADPKSFKVIGQSYSADYNKVYFKENIIPNINPKKIKLLGNYYLKDDKNAVFCGKQTTGIIDVETFEIIDGHFAKDKSKVYLINQTELKPVEAANPRFFAEINTFDSILNTNIKLYSDSNKVFVFEIFDNNSKKNTLHSFKTDTDSFIIFKNNKYIKAQNKIYFDKIQIPEADPKTFTVLGKNYSADKKNIFFKNNKIAQYNSHFEILNSQNFDAQDSLFYYKEGILTKKEQNNIK